jgi:hypothetical protein
MMRTSVTKLARPALLSRTFATTARAMGAGDTGAPPKTGGMGCVALLCYHDGRGLGSWGILEWAGNWSSSY